MTDLRAQQIDELIGALTNLATAPVKAVTDVATAPLKAGKKAVKTITKGLTGEEVVQAIESLHPVEQIYLLQAIKSRLETKRIREQRINEIINLLGTGPLGALAGVGTVGAQSLQKSLQRKLFPSAFKTTNKKNNGSKITSEDFRYLIKSLVLR